MSPAESKAEFDVLATKIRELEARISVMPIGSRADEGGTNACTNCGANCTNCAGDRLFEVLLPGEEKRLSGAELVGRLAASRGK
jgi:hypothetical protein